MTYRYTFVCRSCRQEFQVDGDVRGHMLEQGCVFCDADVSEDDFR